MRKLQPLVLIALLPAIAILIMLGSPAVFRAADDVALLVPKVLATHPHNAAVYTQGLVWYEGKLFESGGNYGSSSLSLINPETGEAIRSRSVHRSYFAEGLALVGDKLIQLTWKEKTAFVYDRDTFKLLDVFTYPTQGWGLCYDDKVLYMSDGTPNLYVRDAQTFALLQTIPVTLRGQPVLNINELECVGDAVYANIWQADFIVRIEKATGKVNAVIDASDLTRQAVAATTRGYIDVLNGIAYQPEKKIFYVTGKFWPLMFEVEFVPMQ